METRGGAERARPDEDLIDTYDLERMQAADENIGHSTRSTDFIAPRSPAERTLRNAVLSLAPHADFARRMVNSGRLSVATVYDTPLSTPDEEAFRRRGEARRAAAGCGDADRRQAPPVICWSVCRRASSCFMSPTEHAPALPPDIGITVIGRDLIDARGDFSSRFDAAPGTAYLLRPDQHVCARWRKPTPDKIAAARDRALARKPGVRSACAVRSASRCRRWRNACRPWRRLRNACGSAHDVRIPRRRRGRTRCRWSVALRAAAGDRSCWRAT